MKNNSVVAGLCGLGIAGLAWIEARNFPIQGLQEGLGAGFFPWLVIGILALASLGSVVSGLLGPASPETPRGVGKASGKTLGILAALVAYGVLFSFLGFVVSTLAFLCLGMFLLGARWFVALLAGATTTGVLYVLFVMFFHVPLP